MLDEPDPCCRQFKLTEADIFKIYEIFKRADNNKDGQLNLDESQGLIQRIDLSVFHIPLMCHRRKCDREVTRLVQRPA